MSAPRFIELHRVGSASGDCRVFINIAQIVSFYAFGDEGCMVAFNDKDEYHRVFETYDEIKALLAANRSENHGSNP